jgi:nitroreductase
MTLLQAIDTRTSVRTYDGTGLDASGRAEIEAILSRIPAAPGGTAIRFVLVDPRPAEGGIKVGTYGVIRGAAAFIVPVVTSRAGVVEERSLFDLGYVGEAVVLELTRLGYGTCWLGGTLRKDDFAAAAGAKEGETVRAVIALGRPADKHSFIEALIRGASRNAVRLPSNVLFYDSSSRSRLDEPCERCSDEDIAEPALRLLAAIRRAPSASNKQPCRVVVSGRSMATAEALRLDLYLMREDRYNALSGYAIQTLDTGIAAAHLELAATELGLRVERRTKEAEPPVAAFPGAAFVAGWDLFRN